MTRRRSYLTMIGTLVTASQIAWSADALMILNDDMANLPTIELKQKPGTDADVKIETQLILPDGKVFKSHTSNVKVAAGTTKNVSVLDKPGRMKDHIVLVKSTVTQPNEKTQVVSAICGSPKPVARDGDYFISMNSHIGRYSGEDQWQMLQMMKAAGVACVRNESTFIAPDAQGNYKFNQKAEQALLASEAFGISNIMCVAYFPKQFYQSDTKSSMAYDWAKTVATRYKGRIYGWQFGNETNSGWAGFGAAADMAMHNKAMAEGVRAADPRNIAATFGIAEALPEYLSEMFRNGTASYFQAVTLHPYCGVAEAGVAKMLGNRRVIAEYGQNQQIWATEIGFHYAPAGEINPTTQQLTQVNGFTLEQQADLLARLYIAGRSAGIDRIFWYDFFGKGDRETFWIVDENFKPRPAYITLKTIAPFINGSKPLGGTAPTEGIQKQLFRHADGSVFMAAWALRDNITADLNLPIGHYKVINTLGESVSVDLTKPVTLGERPIIIQGLPADTAPFICQEILISSADKRSWSNPLHRWDAEAGSTLTIPYVAFNPTNKTVTITPTLSKTNHDWQISMPGAFEIKPGQTVTKDIAVKISQTVVPGTEYRLEFGADLVGPRRANPFESRIWIKGKFPYGKLLVDTNPDEPGFRRPVDEEKSGFGREKLTAGYGSAKVDGDLSEWRPEDFVTLYAMGNWRLRDIKPSMRENWFCRAALRWDSKALYAAFIVLDDDISTLDMISRDWRDSDNVRIFLSTQPAAQRTGKITDKDFLIFMSPTRQFGNESAGVMTAAIGGFVHQGIESKISVNSRVWHSGYLIEAAIPWEALKITPKSGMTLGCNLMGDDADQGYRQQNGLTYLKDMNYWADPRSIGTLELKD